ncbi:MAG: dUTP diphosphatase, partial [Rikenellaceae bacterium]
MVVKVINKSQNKLPQYETIHSAGVDVRADIKEALTIKPLERVMIPTGLFIEIPSGYEVQVRPRSGLAAKHGITILNSPGTIDADYRGELKVILINLSSDPYTLNPEERVAQLVLSQYEQIEWEETIELSKTDRGEGGF